MRALFGVDFGRKGTKNIWNMQILEGENVKKIEKRKEKRKKKKGAGYKHSGLQKPFG